MRMEDKQKDREFQLQKVKVETSAPQRWKAATDILTTIFMLPVYFIWVICVTILLLCKVNVPEFFQLK